jgi:CPA2 family monovalent cation:H+ antiporter-2
MQDLAVVPLLVVISTAGGQRSGSEGATLLAGTLLRAVLLLGAFWVVIRWVIPRLFDLAAMRRDRDSSVVLAVVACLGGTWSAHALGLSPVLGAFASGMLMGDLPYADQIRADVSPLRAAFVTLFFTSIGMLAVPPKGRELLWLPLLAAGIILLKAVLTAAVILALRQPLRVAIRTGVVLAQIGEFSFVLLNAAHQTGALDERIYQLLISSAVVSLFLTPYLIGWAPRIADWGLFWRRHRPLRPAAGPAGAKPRAVIVVGYGPAGKAVVNALRERGIGFLVLELNPRTVSSQPRGFPIRLGDGTRREILERLGVRKAKALVVTLPDPQTAWLVVQQARRLAPDLPILARGRYDLHAHSLSETGATVVVNEEVLVGAQLAGHTLQVVSPPKAEEPPDRIE